MRGEGSGRLVWLDVDIFLQVVSNYPGGNLVVMDSKSLVLKEKYSDVHGNVMYSCIVPHIVDIYIICYYLQTVSAITCTGSKIRSYKLVPDSTMAQAVPLHSSHIIAG